ncbi:MAG TPA: FAD-binding oxidoreductase [Gaiellaceae bacterium]|nr:FAD-binding oxidoreductase [Gaiellaceae bacterium]
MTATAGTEAGPLDALRASFSGTVLEPGDGSYDDARRVHNGLIDRRPALIACCRNTADVADAVRYARGAGLEICVRGGGHNVAGSAVIDGALMIDLSPMRGIYVDRAARTARAQGGVLWRELNRETAVHGLAVTGGAISTTGIAGLTLGGGLGWLMAKYGLAADNVLAIELVTADGDVLDVTETSDPDLFWALRGGGGNFGIAASFEYRLHPLSMITGGLIAHPVDAAGDLLRFYREAAPSASDDLTVFAGLVHAPDGSGMKLSAMVVFHTGTPEEAERELAPFKAWGSPLVVEVGPMPYQVMNTLLDANYPTGSLNYWMSSFTSGLPDGLIDTAIERFASVPSPMSAILLEQFHGAVCRVGVTDTAVPHREEGWNLLLPSVWMDPADTDANIAWTRETHAALAPHLTDRRWLNYLTDDQGAAAIRNAYGPNYDRLVEVKRKVDPENVFHHNQNIAP